MSTIFKHICTMLKKFVKFLFSANVYKTIVFNFRHLPFKQAMRLPIHLYGRVDISERIFFGGGKIEFSSHGKPQFGAWKIGQEWGPLFGYNSHHDVTRVCVEGTLVLGERGMMRNGCIVYVEKDARVEIGTCFWMGHGSKIHSKSSISIKDNCQISWESQIFDTDSHYLMKADGTIDRCTKPVVIGENTWIGNKVTIGKGVKLGAWTVVASNSFVNKDFNEMEHVILGGVPAKVIKTGVTRIWDGATQSQLHQWFRKHPNEDMCNLNEIEI